MKSGEVILANIGRLYGKADLLKLGHDNKICMRESLEWRGGVDSTKYISSSMIAGNTAILGLPLIFGHRVLWHDSGKDFVCWLFTK